MMGIEDIEFFVYFVLIFLPRKIKVGNPMSVPHLLPFLFTCLWISFLRKAKSGTRSRKPMRAKTYVNAPIVLSLTPNSVILETRIVSSSFQV